MDSKEKAIFRSIQGFVSCAKKLAYAYYGKNIFLVLLITYSYLLDFVLKSILDGKKKYLLEQKALF